MGAKPSFPVVSQQGRVAIVTGGNTGIGYEAAKHLAMMGASVIIGCRSEERAKNAIDRMKREAAELKASGKGYGLTIPDKLEVEYMHLDLCSLRSTMNFITDFKALGKPLHLLLCNAGIAMIPRENTDDGFEKMFQVNYLGHFLMVAHFLPVMRKSGDDCRIIFTSSDGHRVTGGFNLDSIREDNPGSYSRLKFYGKSKIYQIMHMFALGRRLSGSGIALLSFHPGLVDTEIQRNYQDSSGLTGLVNTAKVLHMLKTPLQGATTLIDAAVNPKYQGVTGLYLVDCKSVTPTAEARNETYQESLWKCSLECLKDYLSEEDVEKISKP